MSAAFVERRLELRGGGYLSIRFLQPRQDGNDYRCEYRINWPDRERKSHAMGVDAVQALLLAMERAHADLLASPEYKAGALLWLGRNDLGLPLMPNLKPEDFV